MPAEQSPYAHWSQWYGTERPTEPETYSESVRELVRLNGEQVGRLLLNHGASFLDFDAENEYDHETKTWSADDVLAWLGY